MNGIKLTKNSWHRNFYEFWWAKKAPENLCNYFWALLLAVITLPLIMGRAGYEFFKEFPNSTPILGKVVLYIINTTIFGFFAVAIGVALGLSLLYPMQALAVIGGTSLGILVIFLFNYFFFESEAIHIATTAVKAKKNKVCPKIDWK